MLAPVNIDDYQPQILILRGIIEMDPEGERTQEKIREVVFEKSKAYPQLSDLDDPTREAIARYLETQFDIKQDVGFSITASEYKPWLNEKKSTIDFHYWKRLNNYLRAEGELPSQVISMLDNVTDEILNFAGDPNVTGGLNRRGMVIGHVQSGKTSNYSALICKAADSGFKVIILLAGITNSLRRQTQERIDLAFIGKKATSNNKLNTAIIGAAKHATNPKHPDYGTTVESDFLIERARTAAGFQMQNRTQPIIFVLKKNTNTLKNINEYLETISSNQNIPYPLLLIDDEADNASINTAKDPKRITRINESIRRILSKFDRSSYVGYTATPFANIFIDPDSEDEMVNDDVFPSDYIKVLDAPTNYIGPDAVFSGEGQLAASMVICPNDYEEILPLKHPNHHPLEELPASLEQAVRLFIIAKAVRTFRGDGKKHCSMMVNVSRFNSVQNNVHGLIYDYLEDLKNDILLNAGKQNQKKNSAFIELFKQDYQSEFINKSNGEQYPEWHDLKRLLIEASQSIIVHIVNQQGGGLNYELHSESGLDVIAIGGLALSRGLTLEGLCISYVLRNASAYDTLMQMARWFGYRRNYEDLCRLYLPIMSHEYYRDVTVAITELRDSIQEMEGLKLTPKEFGLKVREHPAAIRITAANKMRSAELIKVSIGLSGKNVEGHAIFKDNKINDANRRQISKLVKTIGDPKKPKSKKIECTDFFWPDVSVEEVLKFMEGFKIPSRCIELRDHLPGRSLAYDFIERTKPELMLWDVCITSNEGETGDELDETLIPSKKIIPRLRSTGVDFDNGIYGITNNRVVSSGEDAGIGLAKGILGVDENGKKISGSSRRYNEERDKPLLLIYVIKTNKKHDEKGALKNYLVTYGLNFPGKMKTRLVTKEYQANKVYQQLSLYEDPFDSDEDEELEDILNV